MAAKLMLIAGAWLALALSLAQIGHLFQTHGL